METEELDALELSAADAARALNIPYRTMVKWLEDEEIEGRQTLTSRRFTTVGALRRFLAARGRLGEEALPGLEEYVTRYVAPKHTKGDQEISTKVLTLA